MECFRCISICPFNCLEIDEELDKDTSCLRLGDITILKKNNKNCNECNMCMEVCPMGDINLSSKNCSFCIICKSRPRCISSYADRSSFKNSVISIPRFLISKIRFLTM